MRKDRENIVSWIDEEGLKEFLTQLRRREQNTTHTEHLKELYKKIKYEGDKHFLALTSVFNNHIHSLFDFEGFLFQYTFSGRLPKLPMEDTTIPIKEIDNYKRNRVNQLFEIISIDPERNEKKFNELIKSLEVSSAISKHHYFYLVSGKIAIQKDLARFKVRQLPKRALVSLTEQEPLPASGRSPVSEWSEEPFPLYYPEKKHSPERKSRRKPSPERKASPILEAPEAALLLPEEMMIIEEELRTIAPEFINQDAGPSIYRG